MSDDLLQGEGRPITLTDQIRCIRRELGYRGKVYPNLVARGKMTQGAAAREIEVMGAVLDTLLSLEKP